MSFLSFFRKKQVAPRPVRMRSVRPRLEELESREVLTNDILTVTGTAGSQVTMHFEFHSRQSVLWNEIGVYSVDDDRGRVGDLLPGDAGYEAAALATAQTVFSAGQFEGAEKDLTFTAGKRVAFYLIQNNTLENWQLTNPSNRMRFGNQAFFSIDIVNRDRIDHVRVQKFGNRLQRLSFEDGFGGGDKDFNDAVIDVSFTSQDMSQAIGMTGQSVPTRFKYVSSNTSLKNEVGFFVVDDATGKIGALKPTDDGYAQAAIQRAQVLFRRTARPGAVRPNIQLPGSGFFGLYLIQNGNAASFLRRNPDNSLDRRGPLAFFSFEAANPDGVSHIKWLSATKFAFEDERFGGDKDFNDFVGTMNMRQPPNVAPIVRTGIANINVNHSVADQEIDLAGTFFDADFANSLVRIATNKGTFDLELLDRDAPRSVTNFLNYVLDGDYNNAIFHRQADNPFVLQGGGFTFVNNGGVTTLPAIAADKPVRNEVDATNRPNVRGTIAYAKSTADNATSQFFFNVGSNSVGDSTNLDDTNNTGGFSVFGRIAEGDMSLIDALAAIQTFPKGGVFNELPMTNYTGTTFPGDVQRDNLIVINSMTVIRRPEFLTFAVVSNSDATVVTTSLVHNHLTLDFKKAGTSTITVSATDSVGHTVSTSFNVTLTNNAPVTVANSFPANEDTPLNIAAGVGVLANDTDSDNDPLTAILVSNAANGVVALNSDGSFTYTPNADFNGVDTFTYKANDGQADGNTATVTINVAAVNDPPVAVNDSSFSTNEDTPLNVIPAGVLGNDTDVDNLNLTAIKVTDPANGAVTLNTDGSFTYTPNLNFNGVDSFTYRANDGVDNSNIATVTITVNAQNDAPVGVPESFSTPMDTTLNVAAPGVLSNDTDVENNSLTASVVQNPTHGSLTLNPDGSFTYIPDTGYVGPDSFTYVANDGQADSGETLVSLTVS